MRERRLARLAAVGQRLNAMLQAVKTVRMAMDDFFGSQVFPSVHSSQCLWRRYRHVLLPASQQ